MELSSSGEPPGGKSKKKKRKSRLAGLFDVFTGESRSEDSADNKRTSDIDILPDRLADEFVISSELKDMLRGVLEISRTTAKEIMVPRVDIVGVESGVSVHDVSELVKKCGHSRLPLYEESLDSIIGIIYVKDIFISGLPADTLIGKQHARPPFLIPENKLLSDLLREMRTNKMHLAIVVDEYGGTAGLVTLEDILEEIVGEIQDEYDREGPPIRKIDERQYSVGGGLPVSELNDYFSLDLPVERFQTVGGVIYDIVGGLPAQGTKVTYGGVNFIADRIDGQRIRRVIVELPAADSGNAAGS